MERLLPQNIEAEQGVLGSILIDPEAIVQVADFLDPADFYRDAHRTLYEIMFSLYKQREPADFITLCAELERKGRLSAIGGQSFITGLVNATPTSGNVEYYGHIVARTAVLRRLIHAAGQIAVLAYEQEEDALSRSQQLLFSLEEKTGAQDFYGMPELVTEYVKELDYLHDHKGALTGIPTGYSEIDETTGGMQKTDLILIGGRPSSGKTSLGLCMGYNAALHGHRVAIFSLEMGRKQLMRRMMSMASKVDLQRLRSGWIADDEWENIIEQADNLSVLPIWINDTAGNPVTSIRNQLRRLIAEQGRIDEVIIDYLGLISPEERTENQHLAISKISKGLKSIAKEFDVPVLALCQLSRAVEARQNKRPQLSDLRDSGSLEEDSDVVIFVYRDAYYAKLERRPVEPGEENIAEITIAKQRNGPTGDVKLFFQQEQTMFYNLEEKVK